MLRRFSLMTSRFAFSLGIIIPTIRLSWWVFSLIWNGGFQILLRLPITVSGLNERQPDAEKDDLKDTLNTMESKIRRMRDQRSNHNKSARRFADQRDTIQAEYKELKSKLDDGLKKIKAKKKEANSFRVRRDTAQEQLRVLFARAKSGHIDKRKSKNVTAEFNKLNSTINLFKNT